MVAMIRAFENRRAASAEGIRTQSTPEYRNE